MCEGKANEMVPFVVPNKKWWIATATHTQDGKRKDLYPSRGEVTLQFVLCQNDKCANGGIAECCTKQPRLYFDQAGCCAPCAMEFGIYYVLS